MRVSLFIEDGRNQIILTPDNDHDKAMLGSLREMYEYGRGNLSIREGHFYHCHGGWTREGAGTDSTIIVMDGS